MTEPMTEPLLALQGVTTCYGNIAVLHDIDIAVPKGEIVTLIGANGAGKSTLMMTIFGNPRARQGRILFDGQDITELPTHQIARLGIAQSPEGRRIFSRMTVAENLRLGRRVRRACRLRHRARACRRDLPAPEGAPLTSAAARCRAASSRCSRSRAR